MADLPFIPPMAGFPVLCLGAGKFPEEVTK
jgi:hypothetical protein